MDLVERGTAQNARHPWEQARFLFFEGVLRRWGLLARADRVLDVGAGDAWFARSLAGQMPANARVLCWDTGYTEDVLSEAGFADVNGVSLVRERPAGAFPLLLLLDVLEHVDDDSGFLRALVAETLAPGGHLLFSVPSWPRLFSAHDVALRHRRRYTPRAARAVLRDAGLEILAGGGLFHSLLLPRALQKIAERRRRSAPPPTGIGAWNAPPLATAAVLAMLRADCAVSRTASALRLDLPGLSWWALCRKP